MTLSEALKLYDAKPLGSGDFASLWQAVVEESPELEALDLVASLDVLAAIIEAFEKASQKTIERLRELEPRG